jgi:hypothetical protein
MAPHTDPPARRALALAALTSACLVAALGVATDQASADSTARVQAGTLQITGDGAGDTLTLAQGSTANALDVVVNGQLLSTFDRATFTAVAVDALGGNDTVSVQNMVPALENVTIDGGAGDDTSPAPTAPRPSSAVPATTSSTATSARTPLSSAPATTPSSGIPATAATPSTARAAPTSSPSTAPTSPRTSTSRPTDRACA